LLKAFSRQFNQSRQAQVETAHSAFFSCRNVGGCLILEEHSGASERSACRAAEAHNPARNDSSSAAKVPLVAAVLQAENHGHNEMAFFGIFHHRAPKSGSKPAVVMSAGI
jgi:hypothetical protein